MRKITLLLSAISIIAITSSSCKKKGCTDENATNYDSKAKKDDGNCILPAEETETNNNSQNQQIVTYIINDTIDFSTTGNTYEWSENLGYQGITNDQTLSRFSFKSSDSIGVFGSQNRMLEFNASNNAWLYTELFTSDGVNYNNQVKKYEVGDTVDENGDGSSSGSLVSSIILEETVNTSFSLNSTHYLGLKFVENSSNYYGWVKIKTLNNNYSCIIDSYSVSTEANTSVTITE